MNLLLDIWPSLMDDVRHRSAGVRESGALLLDHMTALPVREWPYVTPGSSPGCVASEKPNSASDTSAGLKDTGGCASRRRLVTARTGEQKEGVDVSDWDFLHEMNDRGFSAEDIADAAAVGYAPWEEPYLSKQWIDAELEDQAPDDASSLKRKEQFRSREGFPYSVPKQIEIFEDLVDCAERHFRNTGRYLQVWGELGEIYAEIKFELRRHGTHQAGSDGTIAGQLVEVKTISPEKGDNHVMVKRQGNFEQLLIVRIDENFQFTGKMIDRSRLLDGGGRFLRARMPEPEGHR